MLKKQSILKKKRFHLKKQKASLPKWESRKYAGGSRPFCLRLHLKKLMNSLADIEKLNQ